MFTATELAALAAALLSLGFSYVPGLSTWYAALEAEYKRLIMLGLLAAVALAVYGLACAGLAADLGFAVTCDRAGLLGLVKALLVAIVTNQGAFLISPKTQAVKRVLAYK